jgi:hypothetical protein
MMAPMFVRPRLGDLARPFTAVEAPHTYAALRIGLGALVIANVSTLWPHLDYLYGDLGVSPASAACRDGFARLSLLCHLPAWGPPAVIILFTAAALAFTLGLWTRLTAILTTFLYATIWWRSGVSWAGEHVFADFLFLLCFARCGEVWSLDRLLRRRRGDPSLRAVPSWPRYLIILQLALSLGVNGWAKSGATWSSGDAIYYVLAHDRFHRFPPWALLDALGLSLTRLLTWTAWITERGFPLVVVGLLLRPRLSPKFAARLADWTLGRRIWAPLAAGTMLGITVLLNVGWFVPATAVAVLCLFRGDELARLLDRTAPPPIAPPPPHRPLVIAAAVFACWHGWTITTRALVPLTGETVAPPIADAMQTWQRATNTTQFWRMFSPDVPTRGHYLRIVAITADGESHDAPSDLDLLEHGRRLKLGYDRRSKIHGTLVENKQDRLRDRHARWVCRTWRAPSGAAPVEVVLLRIDEPLPQPAWTAERGAADPHEVTAAAAREVELTRVRCDQP